MDIFSKNTERKQRIQKSIERLLERCNGDITDKILNAKLIIADEIEVTKVYDDRLGILKKAYNESFGAIKGNVIYQNTKYHLIVLNMNMIDEFKLDDDEFDGVLSHELGHIFNNSTKEDIPSLLHGCSITEQNLAKENNQKKSEFFADYFTKLTNSSEGLISSIEKYISSGDQKNHQLFVERLEVLRSKKEFIGTFLDFK